MSENLREERLAADLEALRALQKLSTILSFETSGEPPDRYTITFRGKGVKADPQAKVEVIELHQLDLRLPFSYPQRPPDIRWLTPVFHPNISFSGFIDLRDVGLPWEPELTLDIVVERLWEVARVAYFNLDKASNFAAKNWYANECSLRLPTDARHIRDRSSATTSSNIISYQRRDAPPPGESRVQVEIDESTPEPDDVLFIGEENTPPPRPKPSGGDDILYIGDE